MLSPLFLVTSYILNMMCYFFLLTPAPINACALQVTFCTKVSAFLMPLQNSFWFDLCISNFLLWLLCWFAMFFSGIIIYEIRSVIISFIHLILEFCYHNAGTVAFLSNDCHYRTHDNCKSSIIKQRTGKEVHSSYCHKEQIKRQWDTAFTMAQADFGKGCNQTCDALTVRDFSA